jgi:hypothetical protein
MAFFTTPAKVPSKRPDTARLLAGSDPTQYSVVVLPSKVRVTVRRVWLTGGEEPCQVSGSKTSVPEPSNCRSK